MKSTAAMTQLEKLEEIGALENTPSSPSPRPSPQGRGCNAPLGDFGCADMPVGLGSFDPARVDRNVRTPEGACAPGSRKAGYTLIELLVVISIMALLAGLVVGMAKYATDNKKITRVEAELAKIITMIENYHHKLGYYPPSGNSSYAPAVTPLYYELSGCLTDPSGNTFTTLGTGDTINKSLIRGVFGMDSFANSAVEKGEAVAFARTLGPADVIEVNFGGPLKLLKVPVRGPQPWGVTNVWHYNSKNPTNNPGGFDLWAEIIVGSRTNVIGNWKR